MKLKGLERAELEKFTLRLFEINLILQKQKEELEEELKQYKRMLEHLEDFFGTQNKQN